MELEGFPDLMACGLQVPVVQAVRLSVVSLCLFLPLFCKSGTDKNRLMWSSPSDLRHAAAQFCWERVRWSEQGVRRAVGLQVGCTLKMQASLMVWECLCKLHPAPPCSVTTALTPLHVVWHGSGRGILWDGQIPELDGRKQALIFSIFKSLKMYAKLSY